MKTDLVTINKTLKPLASIALTGFLMAAVSACGGGGGGGGDPTPGVSSVNPSNGATSVSKTTVVTANFTGSIDAATVDNTTFTLGNSVGDSIAGSVMFDAGMNVATFTPDMQLGVLKTYSGTLSSGITYSGTTPITQYNWSFTTAEGTWTSADKVDIDPSVVASEPHIARGGDSEAMAVWITADGFIYGRKYSSGSWGSINQIYYTTYPISELRVAMDNNGNAMAVWLYDGPPAGVDLYANYYNGTSWGTALSIDSVSGTASDAQVAFDATGNAIVVWKQSTDIRSNRYNTGLVAWEGDQLIEAGAGAAQKPDLAVFDNGDAIAIWAQAGASYDEIVSNYYTANTGWEVAAVPVGNSAAGIVPQVAIDNAGNATAVWLQGTTNDVWVAQFDGASWSSLQQLETDARPSTIPQVGADAQGNAIAVWREASAIPGPSIDRLRYSFYNGTSWATPDYIDNGVADSFDPKLVMDPEGHAVIVWRQKTVDDVMTPDSVWQNRYRSGTGWVGANTLESDETWPVNLSTIDVAIDKNGNAAAVWIQSDDIEGIDSIWASLFE